MSTITATPLSELSSLIDELQATAEEERQESAMLSLEISVLAPVVASSKVPSPDGKRFKRRPTEITDEPGHWDNSYPPKEYVVDRSDERLLLIAESEESERPLTREAYYDYEIVTTTPALLVNTDGVIYRGYTTGTASYGSYAAHPGTDRRQIEASYEPVRDPSIEELRKVAHVLRIMHVS